MKCHFLRDLVFEPLLWNALISAIVIELILCDLWKKGVSVDLNGRVKLPAKLSAIFS